MLIQLRKETTKIPTQLQLNNYLKDLRKNLDGQLETKVCLNDFIEFHQRHKEIPEDSDQMFVGNCEVEVINEEGEMIRLFRIFLTTKRLLTFTNYVSLFICELNCSINHLKINFFQNKRVLSDATYKIIVEGYPILTIGTTDQCRSFHPLDLQLCLEREKKILNLCSMQSNQQF